MEEANKELKKKIESILFAAGKKIELAEIAKLCRMSHNIDSVEKILHELKRKHDSEESPLMLMQEGAAWKLTVRERYVSVVQDIVKQSELSKTIMETLAVVAFKAPVLQSEIIKVRTNKAYDHLRELENSGYISREKKGRTKLIKLSPKFFEYFDIPPEKLKERFQKIEELEKAVEIKEAEAKEIKEAAKEKKAEQKKQDEEAKESSKREEQELAKKIRKKEEKMPEVDLVDEKGKKKKLKTYDSEIAEGTELEEPKSNIEIIGDKMGDLDVVKIGLSDEEKAKLIKEAAALRKEAERAEKGKLKGEEEKEEAEEKEKKFEKKFDLVSGEEAPPEEEKEKELPEEKEAEEEPPEEEAPAETEAKKILEKKPERVTAKGIAAEAAEERKKHPPKSRKGKKLFEKGVPKGIQEKIDERVEEIVFGKKEEKEEKEGGEEEKEEEEKEGEKTPEKY
jgi:segregation and condensation protein B